MNEKEKYNTPTMEVIELGLGNTIMTGSTESVELGNQVNDVEFQSKQRGFWD